jgi:Pro-kumamolisin, activation domain
LRKKRVFDLESSWMRKTLSHANSLLLRPHKLSALLFSSRVFTPRKYAIILSAIALLTAGSVALVSQNTGRRSQPMIHDAVDENKLTTLGGNTRAEAKEGNDLGAVADDMSMDHMLLQLKRPAEQEAAAAQFIEDLHNPKSPNFHKWLTPEEHGKNYGAAEADIASIKTWLESHGFTVNSVYPSGMVMDFSGSAGQIRRAFHTSIHRLSVNGEEHIANATDPQVPSALAPAIAGVVSLHDFRPHKMSRAKYTYTYNRQNVQAVVPADLATIYNFAPLFAKGITGKGQTVAVIEDTDLYTIGDWSLFQSTFGLTQYGGSLSTTHPPTISGSNNCRAPGVNSDDGEAILDAEWAAAATPGATILVAACADTRATSGLIIATQNLVNATTHPSVISISYGSCEPLAGAASNLATENTSVIGNTVPYSLAYTSLALDFDNAESQFTVNTNTESSLTNEPQTFGLDEIREGDQTLSAMHFKSSTNIPILFASETPGFPTIWRTIQRSLESLRVEKCFLSSGDIT